MGVPQITQTCPIGDCPVTITWEFGEGVRDYPGTLAKKKKELDKYLRENHKDHARMVKEAQNV